MNKIYNVVIDNLFNENLKKFSDDLPPDEEVVSTCVVGDRFVICCRRVQNVNIVSRNLLLEEASKVKTPKIVKG